MVPPTPSKSTCRRAHRRGVGSLRWLTRSCAFACLWAVGALGACAPRDAEPAEVPVVSESPARPRNAAQLARAIAGPGVEALVYVERVRNHPMGARIARLEQLRALFEGTGIDPQRELDRAFVAAPTVWSEERSVVVAEHSVAPDRLRAAIEVLLRREGSAGRWRDDLGVPAAQLKLRGHERIVALVADNVLVLLPVALAQEAKRFEGTGGCPDPTGPEVLVAHAVEPARTLRGAIPIHIPESLESGGLVVVLAADGGADLHVDAVSRSPAQANTDAASLSRDIARASTVEIAIVRVRLFEPVEFRAEQDHVIADRHLTPAELDQIMTLVALTMPR